jgi:hypothetical protein
MRPYAFQSEIKAVASAALHLNPLLLENPEFARDFQFRGLS